jgi:hypothetical protein
VLLLLLLQCLQPACVAAATQAMNAIKKPRNTSATQRPSASTTHIHSISTPIPSFLLLPPLRYCCCCRCCSHMACLGPLLLLLLLKQ